MREALAIFMGCVMAGFVIFLLVGSYFWIRASFNRRRPSQRWFVHTNPLNAVLFEDELTPQGLEYRAKAFRALLIALISIVIITLF